MNMQQINIGQLIGQITSLIYQIVSLALLVLVLAAVAGKYGVRIPYVPAVPPLDLAWLAGAWWLYRGSRLA